MTSEHVAELIQRAAAASSPEGFDRAVLTAKLLSSFEQWQLRVVSGDAEAGPKAPEEIIDAVEELRDDMATPQGGAWYTAVFTVEGDGTFGVTFDYDHRPQWDVGLDAEAERRMFVEDLERYPRAPEAVPEWLRAMLP
jgi:hypothetical protein